MISCKKATELISKKQEISLTFQERVRLKIHLMMCGACRAFSKNMDSLSREMSAFRDQNSKDK